MTWKRIAGRECGDGEGRGHKVRRWNNLIVNFNAEPEDEIDEEYSMMDAEDPPADFTPAKCPRILAAINQARLLGRQRRHAYFYAQYRVECFTKTIPEKLISPILSK